jgi:hypothetical protein
LVKPAQLIDDQAVAPKHPLSKAFFIGVRDLSVFIEKQPAEANSQNRIRDLIDGENGSSLPV